MRRIPCFLLVISSSAMADTDLPLLSREGGSTPRVALTNTGTAFVWSLDGLRAAVTDEPPPIPPEKQTILSNSGYRSPAIASDGRNALAVWIEGGTLLSSIVGPGANQSRIGLAFSVGVAAPAVAWNGAKYVVAWSHASNAVLATTVEPNGGYRGVASLIAEGGEQVTSRIAVASSGDESLIVWDRATYDPTCIFSCSAVLRTEIDSVIVNRDARPTSRATVLSANASAPDVAWAGTDYFITWTGFPDRGVFGRRLRDSSPTTISAPDDLGARIAWNGTSLYMIWFHQVFAQYQVFYAPMSVTGALGTATPFAGRFTFEFDIAARPTGSVALVHTPDARGAGTILVRYIEQRRRSVRR